MHSLVITFRGVQHTKCIEIGKEKGNLVLKFKCYIISSDPYNMCYRENLEDDVCSFGCILLEVLMGPKLHEKGDNFILKDLVCCPTYLQIHLLLLGERNKEDRNNLTFACICRLHQCQLWKSAIKLWIPSLLALLHRMPYPLWFQL